MLLQESRSGETSCIASHTCARKVRRTCFPFIEPAHHLVLMVTYPANRFDVACQFALLPRPRRWPPRGHAWRVGRRARLLTVSASEGTWLFTPRIRRNETAPPFVAPARRSCHLSRIGPAIAHTK